MSTPGLFAVGVSHQTAPLELREKLAITPEAAASLHMRLAGIPGMREFAMLSTCNRVEFYGVADSVEAMAALEAAFCAQQNFDAADFGRIRVGWRDRDAVRHLLEVAAGLDSQMLGETEIFGQVKEAYAYAQERRSAGPILNRVFQKTFQGAKIARSSTGITEGQVSVANVAVELALNIFGGLSDVRILLLGAGDIAEKTAKAFQSRGAGSMTVSSRQLERAKALAAQFNASALPFEQREDRLAEFDVVVGSTAAPNSVISRAAAEAAMRHRPGRPLFLIDLAMPRDFDPGASTLENVFLYNLDDLAKIAEENRRARAAEIDRCKVLLHGRADALWAQVARHLDSHANPAPGIRSDERLA